MASRFHKSRSLAQQLFLSATVATASLAASALPECHWIAPTLMSSAY
jgi:hypothetical protein